MRLAPEGPLAVMVLLLIHPSLQEDFNFIVERLKTQMPFESTVPDIKQNVIFELAKFRLKGGTITGLNSIKLVEGPKITPGEGQFITFGLEFTNIHVYFIEYSFSVLNLFSVGTHDDMGWATTTVPARLDVEVVMGAAPRCQVMVMDVRFKQLEGLGALENSKCTNCNLLLKATYLKNSFDEKIKKTIQAKLRILIQAAINLSYNSCGR